MSSLVNIENVQLNFPGVERPILQNINLTVNPGDFIILLGSNGSGKSSLLKLLERRYSASSGSITIDGNPISSYRALDFAHEVNCLTQNFNESLFGSLTVLENCRLTDHRYSESFYADYLQKFNPNLNKKFSTLVQELSGGEKQALTLALCVLNPSRLLLLDEHTSALDPVAADRLMQLTAKVITEKKMTCLLTTHDLNIAKKYGNRVIVLQDGKIIKDINAEDKAELTSEAFLEFYFHVGH